MSKELDAHWLVSNKDMQWDLDHLDMVMAEVNAGHEIEKTHLLTAMMIAEMLLRNENYLKSQDAGRIKELTIAIHTLGSKINQTPTVNSFN